MTDDAGKLANRIWKETVVVCPHNGVYPCTEQHGHGLEFDEAKVAALIREYTLTESEADARVACALGKAAEHKPMIAVEDTEVWIYCSCGFNRADAETYEADPEKWGEHILALIPDSGKAALAERIARAERDGYQAGYDECERIYAGVPPSAPGEEK